MKTVGAGWLVMNISDYYLQPDCLPDYWRHKSYHHVMANPRQENIHWRSYISKQVNINIQQPNIRNLDQTSWNWRRSTVMMNTYTATGLKKYKPCLSLDWKWVNFIGDIKVLCCIVWCLLCSVILVSTPGRQLITTGDYPHAAVWSVRQTELRPTISSHHFYKLCQIIHG